MKKPLMVAGIFLAAFLLYFVTYNVRSSATRDIVRYDLNPEEYSLLKDGDFILRHGYGLVSDGIVQTFNEDYHVSHVGILVSCDTCPHGFKIIHCVSQSLYPIDGVQEQSFPQFLWDSQLNSIMVVRFKFANDTTRHLISKKAIEYLERKVPFDHSFDITDTTSFYCSELPWLVLKNVFHVDIFEGKDFNQFEHLKFEVFWNPKYFDVIINHNVRR
ncbi:MAG: YiiX/YebB-like N1pC/P60 family cysteine hydrolase [Bacteroidales bacterium]|nr:YiiX/YebB-like N1pC/P60 family cysteine hydrolase [Bacteroidales bacterium]